MLQQTRFLAAAFRAYEQRAHEAEAVDEHALRSRLLVDAGGPGGQAADDLRMRPTNACTARSYRAGSRFQEFRWSAPATRM